MRQFLGFGLIICVLALAAAGAMAEEDGWISLFNGKDLDGWTPKFAGHDLGENYLNTFRVEDGMLRVSYDKYESFGSKFGHIFYRSPFTNYVLRVEYRFMGDQVKGGPGWAKRNNGIMIHCQAPETMSKTQKFPNSIEVQLLGGLDKDDRSTMNLCTPGTHVVMNGKLWKQHCTSSESKTFNGDQWVVGEVEVRGDKIIHKANGDVVLEYEKPQLDKLGEDGKTVFLHSGYISFQAESHNTDFRKVEIKPLP